MLIPLANTNLADNVNLYARRRVHIDSDNDDNKENAPRRGWGGSTMVSQSQYYAFQLQNCDGIFSLLHTGRLCPACLKRSSFWHHIQRLPLTINIRLFSAQMTPEERLSQEEFANCILAIGEGRDTHYEIIP